jgi:DNA-binding response OmpR family regulator
MKRILVIEDEPQMRLGLRDNLELEGYEVETAADGDEGLQKANSFTPDLVILDVMLPKKNGFDVCRDLRSRSISTPIVMLTARSAETDKVLGLELGADDYVTKPFSITELLARVRAVLRRTGQQKADRGRDQDWRHRDRLQAAPGTARQDPHRVHGPRVRPASLLRPAHRPGRDPRTDPQRGLGLRGIPDDAHHRQLRGQAASEDRAFTPRARAHPDDSRLGL